MTTYKEILESIDAKNDSMRELVARWARINSHTLNHAGLGEISREVSAAFSVFGEEIRVCPVADFQTIATDGKKTEFTLGPALMLSKRPQAPKKALLVCHMDTVYPSDSLFRDVKIIDRKKITGPGVADAKGGIVVMLNALEAFEKSPDAGKIGWQVIINADEEIGSPGSSALLTKAACGFDLGLVFEPSLPDGNLVGARKGSANFIVTAKGLSAHAGRDFDKGRNAITALSGCITEFSLLSHKREGLTLNVGTVSGGTAGNVVPDFAMVKLNVRYAHKDNQPFIESQIREITSRVQAATGVSFEIHGGFSAPPKALEGKTLGLFDQVRRCAKDLGMDLSWRDSGGVCDGNRLAAAGLPTIDTLGVQGGNIHSPEEYLITASLSQRAKLTTLLLMEWAAGKWDL